MKGEARSRGRVPLATGISLDIGGALSWCVVVDDDLVGLPVAFAWSEHHGACILEHRYEIRHHNGLREEVLGGAEEVGALPFPTAFLLVVVASVTRP